MTSQMPVTSVAEAVSRDDSDGALTLLQQALSVAPEDPETLITISSILRQQGRLRDAVLHCDRALAVDPHYVSAWLERGFVLAAGGSMKAAEQCYLRVVELDAVNADALAGLASLAARNGNAAATREFARRALSQQPYNVIATCAIATLDIETGDCANATAMLQALLTQVSLAGFDLITTSGLLGDALDKQGRAREAFEAYSRSKVEFAGLAAAKSVGPRLTHRDLVQRVSDGLAKVEVTDWALPSTHPIANAAASHVFLMGYPRSGTTLVETILASLPNLVALEERPTLTAADHAFLAEEQGIDRLAALTTDAALAFRNAYWDKVTSSGASVTGKIFVDMDPLKGLRLPVIARLFPGAKIVVMRRDPRDVVWSCFHTNFALTSVAFEFTSLERTARHYASMMALMETSFELLPLDCHIVRYEELVRNFDPVTQDLCGFLDVPWSPDLRNFNHTAHRRGVSTASASQVRKELYDGGRQWERYRDCFEPILPILRPWIERFGYAS